MANLLIWLARIFSPLFGSAGSARQAPFPGLPSTRGLDEPINDAAAYGVAIVEAQPPTGSLYWKVVRVHHLTSEENGFRQHIFFDMADEDGNRLQGGKVRVVWPGGQQDVTLDKPPGEPGGNFPMWKYQVCDASALGMPGEIPPMPSDQVTGLHTGHKDEGPGNRLFHHSFAIVFQRTFAGGSPNLRQSSISGSAINGAGRTLTLLQADGATVAQTTVGSDELYRFDNLAAGAYRVAAPDANVHSSLVEVDGRSAVVVNLTLPPPPRDQSSVSGRVHNGAGLTIELHLDDTLANWTTVPADERYLFRGLPAGRYRLALAGTDIVSELFDLDGINSRLLDLEAPAAPQAPDKPFAHYVLFAPLHTVQGQVDWLLAAPFLQTNGLSAGSHVEHARLAARVTIIGAGPDAPSSQIEQELIAAGCRVERIPFAGAGGSAALAAELAY